MLGLKTLVAVSVLVLAVLGCGGSAKHKSLATAAATQPRWMDAPQVEFGFIKSLTPLGSGYRLRLDLHELFGPDETGLAACIDNHECPHGTTGFLDDTYDHDFKYVVTYYLPANAGVQLVGFYPKPDPKVTARYFYAFAHGKNPRHVQTQASPGRYALSEFGFYVEVSNAHAPRDGFEHVLGLVQVFHP
jgi:hypothetical protein